MSQNPLSFVRRSLTAVPEQLLAVVDDVDLSAKSGVTGIARTTIASVRSTRRADRFAALAPPAVVRTMAELVSQGELDRCVELLGEHSAKPTYEQLVHAIDAMLEEGRNPRLVAVMLASAAAANVPAAPHCLRLLEERDVWALPVIETAAPSVSRSGPDEDVKERRRQRRAEQQQSRAKSRPAAPTHRRIRVAASSDPGTPIRATPLKLDRRRAILTPLESARVSVEHPLVGEIVSVEIEFDAANPAELAVTSKVRPALVVAASATELLVRPIFTNAGHARRPIRSWHRVGLAHESFLGPDRVFVAVPTPLPRVGRLNDDEWNSLL